MSTVGSTATTLTSVTTSFITVGPKDLVFNPFKDYEQDPGDDISGEASTTVTEFVSSYSAKVEILDLLVNPSWSNSSAADKSEVFTDKNSEGGFTYEGFKITRAVSVPCLFLMLVSSILLVYIILKHLRGILYLYISVLFYAFTQVLLVLVMVVSWSLRDVPQTPFSCQYFVTIQSVSLVLPVYGLLFITVVRTIFLRRPFDNDLLLEARFQLTGLCISLCVCGVVFSLPHLGVCEIDLIKPAGGTSYCGYRWEGVECRAFKTSALIVGYILPVLLVLVLYAVIYSTVLVLRTRTRKMTQSVGLMSESSEKQTVSRSKSLEWVEKIRTSMPWCIIIILFLYIVSTVPWIPMELYTHKVTAILGNRNYSTLLFDILYSVLLLGSGLSPLTYLVTSNTLRGLFLVEYRKLRGYSCCESNV
ncbi:uncharacterized protein LOC134819516 [Bolinopsis microptera]|uniref:uncharacterized protein LOC134819516 n=1 Tax=Bolinopsis microptera TaxID=2820187 RepID=UPI0030797EA9